MSRIDADVRRGLALVGIAVAVVLAIWGIVEVQGTEDGLNGSFLVGRLTVIGIVATFMSIVVGTGMRLAGRQPDLAPVGYLTVLVALFGFALATERIASEAAFLSDVDHFDAAVLVTALGLGQVSLLLSWPPRGDRGAAMIVAIFASLVVVAAAVAVMIEISRSGADVSPKLYGTLAVLFLLGHVLTPLTALTSTPDEASGAGEIPSSG